MDIVVHGATGAQGSPVVSALTAAGHRVAGVARHPRDLPPGARAAAVDLADTSALTELYSRADGVFCHLPMAAPEQVGAYARSMGRALAAARPPRIVVSTSGQPVPEAGGEGASPLAILLGILKNSGVHVTVIATRLYLENLLLPPVLSAVRGQGVLRYPLAEDFEASWCSHLDVADAACALLTGAPSPTGVVEVGHLPGLRGCDLAAGLAGGLGAQVRYQAITPQDFGTAIAPVVGREAAAPVVAFYEGLALADRWTIEAGRSAQQLLDLRPRGVTAWLREILPQRPRQ